MIAGAKAPNWSSKPAWRHPIRVRVGGPSERGPRDRGPFATWPWQSPSTEQQVCAVYQRCDLSITEQLAELVGCLVASFSYGGQLPAVQLGACPPPQQCPKLVISMEAQSMINSEHPAGAPEDVTSLAIGIVDQDVEDGEQPQVGNIGVDHRDRAIIRIKAFHGREPAFLGYRRTWNKINELVGRRLVDIYPYLYRPGPERAVGQHRDRHAVEAADPGHLVRSHLSEAESTVREVPERPLSLQRLVDAFDGFSIHLQLGQEGGVRRLQQAAGDLKFGFLQLCGQCGVGRPSGTVLAQATKIISSQRRNQSNSGRR